MKRDEILKTIKEAVDEAMGNCDTKLNKIEFEHILEADDLLDAIDGLRSNIKTLTDAIRDASGQWVVMSQNNIHD